MGWQGNQVVNELIVIGTAGGVFVYNAAGLLVSADVGADTADPVQGITCHAGFSTFNTGGFVINLLSTVKSAFFQYQDTGISQGALILAVASTGSTDPVLGTGYSPGLNGINPAFGSVLIAQGAVLFFGLPVFTQSAELTLGGGSGATGPGIFLLGPEQGQSGHLVMAMTGVSPDGTQPAQLIVASEPTGTAAPAPVTKALAEFQGTLALTNTAAPASVTTAAIMHALGGQLKYVAGASDGNDYNTGRLLKLTAGQNVTSTSNAAVSGWNNIPVAAATYFVRLIIEIDMGATGSPAVVGVNQGSAAFTSARLHGKLHIISNANQSVIGTNVLTSKTTWTTPALTANTNYMMELSGEITFTAAGTFGLVAAEGTAGDTWTIPANCSLILEPAS